MTDKAEYKFVNVECPYCGRKNVETVELNELAPRVILCGEDMDRQGCDRYFAALIKFTPSVKTYKMEE